MPRKPLNIRTLKKKIEEHGRHKLFKYEQDYYWTNRRDEADHLAQKYPKLVAFKGKEKIKCITCDNMMEWKDCNGSHRIEKGTSGTYWCRWKEWNIYACCIQCNHHNKQTHTRRLTAHVTSLYGAEQVEERQKEDWQPHSKPKRYEIDEAIEYYREKIEKLEKSLAKQQKASTV